MISNEEILESTSEIKQSSKTIASIESLLKQRKVIDLPQTNFLQHLGKLTEEIQYLEAKEKKITRVRNAIQNSSTVGEVDDDFKAFLNHIASGGSVANIEQKFDIEKIEMQSESGIGQHAPIENKYLIGDEAAEDTYDGFFEFILASFYYHVMLFLRTWDELLHAPIGTSWQKSKKKAKMKLRKVIRGKKD